MNIYVGSDHAGYSLKKKVISFLEKNTLKNINLISDCGPFNSSRVDYPDFADRVCKKVLSDENSLGVLVCGSGQGMSIRANKYKFIRAALCVTEEMASLSKNHNNANVLCLGSRLTSEEDAYKIILSFLNSSFEGGRHKTRVEKISAQTRS